MLGKAAVVAALVMLAGCGVTKVDTAVVEASIEKDVKEHSGFDATADCPDHVDWETGKTFECKVEGVEGYPMAVATMTDDGNVTWELVSG